MSESNPTDESRDGSLDALRQAFGKAAQWFASEEDDGGESSPADDPATESAAETPSEVATVDSPRVDPQVSPRTILEAMLFVGNPENKPLAADTAAERMRGVDAEEVKAIVAELNADYDDRGCPYHIATIDNGYRLVLRDEFLPLRDNFYGKVRQARLSQAAIDVLALVAYRQPLSREQVDELRGRESGTLLRQLVRRELLRLQLPENKSDPRLYFTTDRFLKLFQLESLNDLPRGNEMDVFTQN